MTWIRPMSLHGSLRTWAALAFVFVSGCQQKSPPRLETEAPPEPLVFGPQDDVLLTYQEPETGRFRTVEAVADIPEPARGSVVVTDLSRSPQERGSSRYVHVADLRNADEQGRFTGSVASRHAFGRGPDHGGTDTDPSAATGAPVVVYSASWCGVCRKTKRLLSELGVPFEDKDIEASKSALEELGRKAALAGLRPGGVPVIDVKGQLLQGLDPDRLKNALRTAGLLTESRALP